MHCAKSETECIMLVISFFRLKLEEQVGEGAFGRVVKATATGITNRTEPLTVAVKMLKGKIKASIKFLTATICRHY